MRKIAAIVIFITSLLTAVPPASAQDNASVQLLERQLAPYITRHYGIFPEGDLPKHELADMAVWAVRLELERLGFDRDLELGNVRRFVFMVKQAESSGNRYAESSANAMSFFQFKPASVITAVNRLSNWTRRHNLGPIPPWAEVVRDNPAKIYELQESLQALLMMINIIEQTGSDEFLMRLIFGDTDAVKPLYYQFHHTNPDHPTIALIERLFDQHFDS